MLNFFVGLRCAPSNLNHLRDGKLNDSERFDFPRFDFPWTSEQVLGLSQHDYHVKTSREMAYAHKWQRLGKGDLVIWGDIPIKDKPGIQTRVALEPLRFACSCVSYQYPCNHALGLLLLYISKPNISKPNISKPTAFVQGELPLWATDVLRHSALMHDEVLTESEGFDTSESLNAKRWARMQAGIEDLERWLLDIVKEGLEVTRGKTNIFAQMADRLVDAQLSELAKDVRQLSALTVKNPRWHEDLLGALGRLYLLVEGFKHYDTLSKDNQADLALALGWLPALQDGSIVRDRWHILGRRLEPDVGRKVLRLWLWGETTHRPAMLVEMVHGKKSPSTRFLVGGVLRASLQFYPGCFPVRAELTDLEAIVQPQHALGASSSIKEAAAIFTRAKAKNPWLKTVPLVLQNVFAEKQDEWYLRDAEGYILPLPVRYSYGWHLRALSASGLWIFGEFDGKRFLPLSVWGNERIIELHTLRGVS
jgi:hypothetical protein